MDHFYRILVRFLRSCVNLFIVLINIGKTKLEKVKIEDSSKEILVLGNGPSLNDSYNEIIELDRNTTSVFAVNSFADSSYFEIIKPEFYALVDPRFFWKTEDKLLVSIQNRTSDSLMNKTNWKLNLLVPGYSENSELIKKVSKNININLVYFNNVAIYEGSDTLNCMLYKKGYANPPFRNVLIAAIFFSLKIGFKTIKIYGADHSWHENLFLGSDNKLYTKEMHFFDEDNSRYILKNDEGQPAKVHEQLYSIVKALSIYHSLEKLSVMMGAKIINRSSKTWIDAFSRE